MLTKILLTVAGLYGVLVLLMYLGQTWMMFPTGLTGGDRVPVPAGAERLTLDTADGDRLEGVAVPPATGNGDAAYLILVFPGNAWNAHDAAGFIHDIYPESRVVAFHYRGYSPSTGRPSARAIMADGVAIHDLAVERFSPTDVVAVGLSIGSGPAAHLAASRSLGGLILVSPFDSLTRLAREHYPWLPVGLLMRHRMAVSDRMRETAVPTAIIAAANDTIVPPGRTEALKPAVQNLVFDRVIAGAGHNDMYARPEFGAAMVEALQAIRVRREHGGQP